MTPPAQRICARLRDEFAHKKISQRAIAERLTTRTGEVWSQPAVHKILTGQVRLTVNDLFLLAELAGLSPVELVRQPGLEFVADLAPTELTIIQAMRDRPELVALIAAVVGPPTPRAPSVKTRREQAAARPRKRKPW